MLAFLLLAYGFVFAKTPTVLNLSGGGAAAMSIQAGLLEKLIGSQQLDLESLDEIYCVSGGCVTALLLSHLGIKRTVKFMESIKEPKDALHRNSFTSTALLKWNDGMYNFEPLKKRVLAAIKGTKPKFKVVIQVAIFETMKSRYVDITSLPHQEKVNWMAAAKAVPGLVETYQGIYTDAAIVNSFATDPIFERPDFATLNMVVVNARVAEPTPWVRLDAFGNLRRTIEMMLAQKNLAVIGKIFRKMKSVGNGKITVYSASKQFPITGYDAENFKNGLAHGRNLVPMTEKQLQSL